jgi:hypothetical protein
MLVSTPSDMDHLQFSEEIAPCSPFGGAVYSPEGLLSIF